MITTAMILWANRTLINSSGSVDLPPGCTTEELSHLVRLGVSDKTIDETCNPVVKLKREKEKRYHDGI